jgi:predicted phosphodiesterase
VIVPGSRERSHQPFQNQAIWGGEVPGDDLTRTNASGQIVAPSVLLESTIPSSSELRMPQVTFGIISDLHCRLATDSNDSFLKVASPRVPSGRHPVQSLLELIDRETLTVDILLVSGDLANKACREGLDAGWNYCLEIGAKLRARLIIPVIGNHDIDSRRLQPAEPVFGLVRNMRPDFPFQDIANNQSYFADGYCVIADGDVEVIALNTVIDQIDEDSAKRGTFSFERIQRMEDTLSGTLRAPLRVVLMHHHPILHSGTFLGDEDVIATGDDLVAALRRLGCRVIIHGHKHIPRLSTLNDMSIFASGSFSALLHEFGTTFGNTFHVVRVEGSEPADVKGQIMTWVFQLGKGWRRSNEEYRGFPYLAGFGSSLGTPAIALQLADLANRHPGSNRFLQIEVLAAVPEVSYLTPSQREDLNAALLSNDLKISSLNDGQLELWRIYKP